MPVNGYKNQVQHGQLSTKTVGIRYRFNLSCYPTGTDREGCVVLLQATDEELGSSDSRDCREDLQ